MNNRAVQQLNNWLVENGLEGNLSALVTVLGKTINTYLQETGKQISELQKKVNEMEQGNQQMQQQQAAQNQSKTDVNININAVIEQAIDKAVDKAVDKAAKAFAEQLKNTR
ncbi:MAG: hypothetical protein OXI96_03670 [Acidimicrobiaceae bacterium]|nr:hypothetical protein [Acidimicrobiaceae bacterium]